MNQNNYTRVRYGFKCVLKTCKNKMSDNRDISFFSFPVKDPIKCAKWIESCGLSIPLNVVLNKRYKICGEHFEEDMFMNNRQNRLLPHAVPVLKTDFNDCNEQEICSSAIYVQNQEVKYNKNKIITTKEANHLDSGVFLSKNKRKLYVTDSNKIDECQPLFVKNGINEPKNQVKYVAIPKNVFETVSDTIKNRAHSNIVVFNPPNNDFYCNDAEKKNLDMLKDVYDISTKGGSLNKYQPHVDTLIPDIQVKKNPETVIGNTLSLKSLKYNVLEEHNYFNDIGKKKNRRWNHKKCKSLCSSGQSNDDSLPEWCKTNSDDEDGNSDTEIKSLAQLLKLEYEKDLSF